MQGGYKNIFDEIADYQKQIEQNNNYNRYCDIMESKIPVKSETRNACYEFDNYKAGISIKNDYNYKGEVINRQENRYYIQKNK